jgi:hypothetical protein
MHRAFSEDQIGAVRDVIEVTWPEPLEFRETGLSLDKIVEEADNLLHQRAMIHAGARSTRKE